MNVRVLILFAVSTTVVSHTLFPSGWTVVNPLSDATQPLGISLLYCRWTGTAFSSCPAYGVSYHGVANFDTSGAFVKGHKLTIPFEWSYKKSSVCTFEFESTAHPYLHTVKGWKNKVEIYLFDITVTSSATVSYVGKNWADVASTFLTVTCLGATSNNDVEFHDNITVPAGERNPFRH